MIDPIVNRLDILKWSDWLNYLGPLACGDTIEMIIAKFLVGQYMGVCAKDKDGLVQGFCIYSFIAVQNTIFIQAIAAPNRVHEYSKEFFNWLALQYNTKKIRFASKHPDSLWAKLLPGVKKLWSVYEYEL